MGGTIGKCINREFYKKYLEEECAECVQNLWAAINLYKMKHMFLTNSVVDAEGRRYLPFTNFINLLSQIKNYKKEYQIRIYEIFCSREKVLYWEEFFSFINLCYFASTRALAALIFIIFDTEYNRILNLKQVEFLLTLNISYLHLNVEEEESEEIAEKIVVKKEISLNKWIEISSFYIDYNEYRKLFNIFVEPKIEKELVIDFEKLNEHSGEDRYMVPQKWFEAWVFYVKIEYRKNIENQEDKGYHNLLSKSQKSIQSKSMKSIKTSKSINQIKSLKKTQDQPKMKPFQIDNKNLGKNCCYDLIGGNFGDKPEKIYTHLLEGEYLEVMNLELIENIDYVSVSTKVWKTLQRIYGAETEKKIMPLFKIIKIYFTSKNGKLVCSERHEIIVNTPNTTEIREIFLNAVELESIEDKFYYYKAIDSYKWRKIENLSSSVCSLSLEQLIFFTYVNKAYAAYFEKNYCNDALETINANVGDGLLYEEQYKMIKKAYYMGKSIRNKHVLHIKDTSYLNDIELTDKQLREKTTFSKKINSEIKGENEHYLSKHFPFVNALLLQLFSNNNFCNKLEKYYKDESYPLLHYLAEISLQYKKEMRIESFLLYNLLNNFFEKEINSSLENCYSFMEDFEMAIFEEDSLLMEEYNIITSYTCSRCKKERKLNNLYSLILPIPESMFRRYEIIFIPYAYNMKMAEYKKYGIILSNYSTLRDYKTEFEKHAVLEDTPYMLMEIYRNVIIRKFEELSLNSSLEDLNLRENDKIYAFELPTSLQQFVTDHYECDFNLSMQHVKENEMVDFRLEGWMCGVVRSIESEQYTSKQLVKVEYFSNNTEYTVTTEFSNIALFPTQSYLTAEHYYVRVIQRIYNENQNRMEPCNLPLVCLVSSWMRIAEIHLIIYQLIRGFISEDYKFKHFITMSTSRNDKMNKFKKYLTEKDGVPYLVRFTDKENRCKCYKIQKSVVLENEEEYFCEGCSFEEEIPISWQINVAEMQLCVDWKEARAYTYPRIANHSSYEEMEESKTKDKMKNIDECLKMRFDTVYENEEEYCCNSEGENLQEEIIKVSKNAIISLNRIENKNDCKTLSSSFVDFNLESFTLMNNCYNLKGIIGIQWKEDKIKYFCYIFREEKWFEYDEDRMKIVKKGVVNKICALVYFYEQYNFLSKNN